MLGGVLQSLYFLGELETKLICLILRQPTSHLREENFKRSSLFLAPRKVLSGFSLGEHLQQTASRLGREVDYPTRLRRCVGEKVALGRMLSE